MSREELSGLVVHVVVDDINADAAEKIAARIAAKLSVATPGRAQPGTAPLLTTGEAARVASVSTKTIRAWVSAGKLRAFRAGRHLRFREDEVFRVLEDATSPSVDVDGLAAELMRGPK